MQKVFKSYVLSFLVAMALIVVPLMAEAAAPILVEGAMECETDLLIRSLENPQEQRIGGWRFISGEYQGIPVVVSVTSVGMTNAAAATVLGIEHYHPVAVINQGTAGGHDPALHTFDIVLGEKTIDASAWRSSQERSGADGRHIELRPTYYYDADSGEEKETVELAADPELLEVAVAEGENYQAGQVVKGKISSSNNWNRQMDKIRFLNKEYGSSCEEMEAHSAAQVCQNYKVPFLGIRVLSNTEVHGEDFNPYSGTACQQFVLAVIKSYAERKALDNGEARKVR
jgi:adenosylhomocysteine nucleosidase